MIAYNIKHKKKNRDFRSPFKELAVFADIKRKVVKTQSHTISAPKVIVFTQVRAYSLCLKTFEFVSFYTQKLKFSSETLN